MSLRWNETVQLVLRPEAVSVVRSHLGLGGRVRVASQALPATGALDASVLLGLATELLTELDATQPLRRCRLDVVVSDALAHLGVVSGDFFVQTDHQIDRVAQAWIGEMLGSTAPAQAIRWQLQRDHEHLLLVALDAQVLAALEELSLTLGMRLGQVEPLFAACWNVSSHLLRATGEQIFAAADLDHAVIASVQRGVITGLSQGSLAPGALSLDLRADRLVAMLGRQQSDLDDFVLTGFFAGASPRWNRLSLPAGWHA